MYHSEAGFQVPSPSGTYTETYVTFVRGSLLLQLVSSVPCGYPYMRSLPHHPRGSSSFMPPIQRASSTLVHVMVTVMTIFSVAVEAGKFIFGQFSVRELTLLLMTMLLFLGICLAARRYLLPLTSLLHIPTQSFWIP